MSAGLLVPAGYTMPTGSGWGQNVLNADGDTITLYPIVRSFTGNLEFWGAIAPGLSSLFAIIPATLPAVFIGSPIPSTPPSPMPTPPPSSKLPPVFSDPPYNISIPFPSLPPIKVPPPNGPSGPAAFIPTQPHSPGDTVTIGSVTSYATGGTTYYFQLTKVVESGTNYYYQAWTNSSGSRIEDIYLGASA